MFTNPMGTRLTSHRLSAMGLVPVRLSATILNEYDTRCPEFVPEWIRNNTPKTFWMEAEVAQALHDDARFNADAKSGPEEMPAGTRSAYRALAVQLARHPKIKAK